MTSQVASKALRILVVEDEVLIQMLFEDMLADLGHTVEAATGDLDKALSLARECACDAAILDVHLRGVQVFPVAEVLAERGIPFLFATGSTDAVLPEQFRGRPAMGKPFQPERLKEILANLFDN